MEKYRDWDILDEIPEGWVIDKLNGSPIRSTVFITNGKSPISGQCKRALLRLKFPKEVVNPTVIDIKEIEEVVKPTTEKQEIPYIFPSKTVNDLARLRFKEQLLKEIMFDLTVCDLEKWDKNQYINELKKLLNGIDTSKKQRNSYSKQLTLFSL